MLVFSVLTVANFSLVNVYVTKLFVNHLVVCKNQQSAYRLPFYSLSAELSFESVFLYNALMK